MNAEASLFREGLAQFRFLLCRQVAGDEVGIHVLEGVFNPIDDGVVGE